MKTTFMLIVVSLCAAAADQIQGAQAARTPPAQSQPIRPACPSCPGDGKFGTPMLAKPHATPPPAPPPVRAAAVKAAPRPGCYDEKCGVAEIYCACHDREPDGGPERACFPTIDACRADLPGAAAAKMKAARKSKGTR